MRSGQHCPASIAEFDCKFYAEKYYPYSLTVKNDAKILNIFEIDYILRHKIYHSRNFISWKS